jgi:hypothetical protein
MNNFSNEEYSQLASLGITFDIVPNYKVQPELVILSLLNREEFIGNYMYGMLKLLFDRHHLFFRVDVFIKGSKTISAVGKATLSALSSYCVHELNDKRFKKLKKFTLKNELLLNTQEYVASVGAEPYLIERGIVVRRIAIQSEKKILTTDWVFKNNIWFRNRLLFGLGVRADAFSSLQITPIKTYYQLSKILGSSLFSARKSFQDFYKIKKLGLEATT